jgi:hypothetical protein
MTSFAVLEKSSQSMNVLHALRVEKNLQVCLKEGQGDK